MTALYLTGVVASLLLLVAARLASTAPAVAGGGELQLAAATLRCAEHAPVSAWRVVWACCAAARRRVSALRDIARAARARGRKTASVRRLKTLGWSLWLVPGVAAWVLCRRQWHRVPGIEADLLRIHAQVEAELEAMWVERRFGYERRRNEP